MSRTIKYFRVDDTGWSGGISWFEGDCRFDTFEEARQYQKEKDWGDNSVKWRIAEVSIDWTLLDEKKVAMKVIQERYLYL